MARKELTVVDLFSGTGGLSEGFEQMGFKTVFALDYWGPAVKTFEKNHPDAEVKKADILDVEPSELPHPDIVIGGPPCVEFSFAKRGGKGDIAKGMKLVLRFLQFVAVLKPKWWVMENVPRLLETLPPKLSLKQLGIDRPGNLEIPQRNVLCAADYGTPQKRYRAISGRYPLPEKTHVEQLGLHKFTGVGLKQWVPMRRVIEGLPNPLSGPKEGEAVKDPNYGFSIPQERLTLHFMDTLLTDEEARECRKLKVNHSWYGRMKFPDDLDAPARTVTATHIRPARENIVIEVRRGRENRYRALTIRETACVQSFPITYQFWGGSEGANYRLVGDAVPPLMSAAIARAMLREAGLSAPENPYVEKEFEMPPALKVKEKPKMTPFRHLRFDRKFRDHVPSSKGGGFRVDIDNMGENPAPHPFAARPHLREWVTRLYTGSGKIVRSRIVTLDEALEKLLEFSTTPERSRAIEKFVSALAEDLPTELPDATTLQGIRAEWVNDVPCSPYRILERIAEIVGQHFPESGWRGIRIPPSGRIPIIGERELPIRIAAALVASSFACEVINGGDEWLVANWRKQFRPKGWPPRGPRKRMAPERKTGERLLELFKKLGQEKHLPSLSNTS